MIDRLQLPFQFDPERLKTDIDNASSHSWVVHFNTYGYDGDWSVIPLYAPGGDASNINALHTDQREILPTPLLDDCPYLKEVIESFKCKILTARLMKLEIGSVINPHKDHASGYEDGMFRLHIPVTTNSEVEFILNGEQLIMKEGECWYTNVNFEHSVANRGKQARIHLVIDGERNDWSDSLFFSLAPRDSFFPKEEERYSKETLVQMIDSLKLWNDPAYEPHIIQLQKQLDALE